MSNKKAPLHKISLTEFANSEGIPKFIVTGFKAWITLQKKMKVSTRTKAEWKKLYNKYLSE